MNASYLFSLGFVLVGATFSFAQTTQAVLLNDFSIIEGKVEKIDGFVRITPTAGLPKLVLAKQVEHLAESRDAIYAFVLDKGDTTTAEGLIKLASWCEKVGMNDRATSHAKAALAISPTHVGVRELLARLSKSKEMPSAVKQASATALATPPATLLTDSGIVFNAKVQPVLMNKCASCHTHKSYTGTFKLDRIADGFTNPEATAANLKVVTLQLSGEQPIQSPLLLYSLTAHGGQKLPAFANREVAGYQNLENWVRASLPAPAPVARMVPVASASLVPVTPTAPIPAEPNLLPGSIVSTTPPPMALEASPPKPSRDPFDPNKFNTQPKKK